MTTKKKIALLAISVLILLGHAALFIAGGTWRTAGIALLVVDVFVGLFVLGAVKETRKLEAGERNRK